MANIALIIAGGVGARYRDEISQNSLSMLMIGQLSYIH